MNSSFYIRTDGGAFLTGCVCPTWTGPRKLHIVLGGRARNPPELHAGFTNTITKCIANIGSHRARLGVRPGIGVAVGWSRRTERRTTSGSIDLGSAEALNSDKGALVSQPTADRSVIKHICWLWARRWAVGAAPTHRSRSRGWTEVSGLALLFCSVVSNKAIVVKWLGVVRVLPDACMSDVCVRISLMMSQSESDTMLSLLLAVYRAVAVPALTVQPAHFLPTDPNIA